MFRSLFLASLVAAGSFALATEAKSQIVTSYYAPPAVAPVVAPAAVASPIVGTIPMRRGLFGWRVENVPVFAPGTVVAPAATLPVATSSYQAARPVIAAPVYAASPITTSYMAPSAVTTSYMAPSAVTTSYMAPSAVTTSYMAPTVVAPVASMPSAVVQSGYRGTAVIPAVPITTVPVNAFYPGAVMTMQ